MLFLSLLALLKRAQIIQLQHQGKMQVKGLIRSVSIRCAFLPKTIKGFQHFSNQNQWALLILIFWGSIISNTLLYVSD